VTEIVWFRRAKKSLSGNSGIRDLIKMAASSSTTQLKGVTEIGIERCVFKEMSVPFLVPPKESPFDKEYVMSCEKKKKLNVVFKKIIEKKEKENEH
jgi:hypothetical protein